MTQVDQGLGRVAGERPATLKLLAQEPMYGQMFTSPACPQCSAELKLGASGKLDAWACPNGHGAGFTLSEVHEHAQEDEISEIWRRADRAPDARHACPMCDRPMVSVTIGMDADELADGERGDARDSGRLTLEVCRDDQFMWFDPGELDELPADLPEPEPSAAEQAKLAEIRAEYSHSVDEALEDDSPLGRFAEHMASRHPGFVKFLDRVVYRDAADELDAA